ncbi:MAG: NUDIX hydrolase [Candidatus Latescibacterota bacterium]
MASGFPGGQAARLSREVIYQSPWVNLVVDKVRMPQGRIVDRYHVLDFDKEAVAAVVENAQGEVLMIESYRYVLDSVEWEVPAGLVDEGEAILEAAQREVMEETGYCTTSPRLLYTFYPMDGMANKVFHVVGCLAGEATGSFDGNEVRAVHWRSPDQVRGMVRANQIRCGFTLAALLLHLTHGGRP